MDSLIYFRQLKQKSVGWGDLLRDKIAYGVSSPVTYTVDLIYRTI